MSEYHEWAQIVVEALWEEGATAVREERLIDDAVWIDVFRFSSWYYLADRFGAAMLAVNSDWGRRVVIPSFNIGEPFLKAVWFYERVWGMARMALEEVTQELRLAHPDAVEISPEEARSLFKKGLVDFMVARREGTEELEANAESLSRLSPAALSTITVRNGNTVPGCRFTVTSNTPGLRALWSPAYGITSNAFGHPTNPVSSYLLSGTYIFGVDGGAYVNPAWDHAQVTLPGPNTSVHLNF